MIPKTHLNETLAGLLMIVAIGLPPISCASGDLGADDEFQADASTSADCIDNDGDGYGYGCSLGADCDDNNATCGNCPDACQANGIIEVCTAAGGVPADEDLDGAIDEGCSCESGDVRTCCGTSVQLCNANGDEFGSVWSDCTTPDEFCNGLDDDCNGAIDDGTAACATTQCDELPPTLGGYRVGFEAGSAAWTVATDGNGNPLRADGYPDIGRSCSIQVERIEDGQSRSISVPATAHEVFFQVVGGGGGGGRYWSPPSTGGGAGAYATGIAALSGVGSTVSFTATAGTGGDTESPGCSEDACNFTCECPRGVGDAGTNSTLTVAGITVTASAGAGGTWGVTAAGGNYSVGGASSTVAVQVNPELSAKGNDGQPGSDDGHSGTGGSAACNWGSGAVGNQSGTGYGAGGGAGNNSPAGHGASGLIILMWVTCS